MRAHLTRSRLPGKHSIRSGTWDSYQPRSYAFELGGRCFLPQEKRVIICTTFAKYASTTTKYASTTTKYASTTCRREFCNRYPSRQRCLVKEIYKIWEFWCLCVHASLVWFIIDNQQDENFWFIYLYPISPTCLGRRFRPSSGALDCICSFWYSPPMLLPAGVMDEMELPPWHRPAAT